MGVLDVHDARVSVGRVGHEIEATSGSLILELPAVAGDAPEYRVYLVTSSPGKYEPELTVTRLRMTSGGKTLSSQTLATPLGGAKFGKDEASGLLTLSLAAPFVENQKLSHEYTALAALSGGRQVE